MFHRDDRLKGNDLALLRYIGAHVDVLGCSTKYSARVWDLVRARRCGEVFDGWVGLEARESRAVSLRKKK